jgi:hypothetical protein
MTLPPWNNEWEKPDPLGGRQGWGRHHYAAVGVAVALFVTAFGVVVPAVMRARQTEAELDRTYEALRAAFDEGAGGTLKPR